MEERPGRSMGRERGRLKSGRGSARGGRRASQSKFFLGSFFLVARISSSVDGNRFGPGLAQLRKGPLRGGGPAAD